MIAVEFDVSAFPVESVLISPDVGYLVGTKLSDPFTSIVVSIIIFFPEFRVKSTLANADFGTLRASSSLIRAAYLRHFNSLGISSLSSSNSGISTYDLGCSFSDLNFIHEYTLFHLSQVAEIRVSRE